MALSFPLGVDQFFSKLPVGAISFDAPPQNIMDLTGGGDVLTADVGPQLWRCTVTLGTMTEDEASWAQSMLDVLQPAGRSFMAHDIRRPGPRLDRRGILLGAAKPTLHTVTPREIRIQGLPAGYTLSNGDYLGFGYSGRFALHRVINATVQASAGGLTPLFEVSPMIRSGAAAGAAVTLIRAACKMRLVPGSIEPGKSRRTITTGMAFSAIQTLR